MKTPTKYFFGYYFVRLAKVIGILAILATLSYIGITTNTYLEASKGAQYGRDEDLRQSLSRANEELQYAKKEVGRITLTTDLPDLTLPALPRTMEEFEPVAAFVQQADAQRQTLKQRLLAKLESSITTLQGKIAETIRSIERTRRDMESQPPPTAPTTPTALAPAAPTSALDGPARTMFGVGNTDSLHRTLQNAHDFFSNLAEKAEKEENKTLLKSTIDEIGKLKNWIPEPPKPMVQPRLVSSPSGVTTPQPAPEVDPLETALATHQSLERMLIELRSTINENWILDGILGRTATTLETERDQCRIAETLQRTLRSAWLTDSFLALLAGIAAVFMILVFADFIQSFFDTASSAGQILARLEEQKEKIP